MAYLLRNTTGESSRANPVYHPHLPNYLGLDKTYKGINIYADDTCLCVADGSAAAVKSRLEELAHRLADYSLKNFLSLNADKTQIFWIGASSLLSNCVGSTAVPPAE